MINANAQKIVDLLKQQFPGATIFRRKHIHSACEELGLTVRDYLEIITNEYKVRKGVYDYTKLVCEQSAVLENTPGTLEPTPAAATPVRAVSSVVNSDVFVPKADPTYVQWGDFTDIVKVIESKNFYPIYIAGLSGNGKTMMIEQACAKTRREYIRVQISPETDEDDLIGGFRLLNGETVFAKGPVLKAMERGAVLLIDELDRGTNKIMCLQGVLEGKPVLVKKTGEIVHPAPGFNVFATANTKGKGSDDGRFVAAQIIDEAFLERFVATLEQPYPTRATERRIVEKHMNKYSAVDADFADKLTVWSEVIRKTFDDGGVEEVISTRRLCHIAHSFSIFRDRMKAIKMCISRFDADTKTAFLDLYTKIDPSVNPDGSARPAVSPEPSPRRWL